MQISRRAAARSAGRRPCRRGSRGRALRSSPRRLAAPPGRTTTRPLSRTRTHADTHVHVHVARPPTRTIRAQNGHTQPGGWRARLSRAGGRNPLPSGGGQGRWQAGAGAGAHRRHRTRSPWRHRARRPGVGHRGAAAGRRGANCRAGRASPPPGEAMCAPPSTVSTPRTPPVGRRRVPHPPPCLGGRPGVAARSRSPPPLPRGQFPRRHRRGA
eukprot:COSAG01_NODE_4431_length_5031_cov_3.383539_7_plen_213_part_00